LKETPFSAEKSALSALIYHSFDPISLIVGLYLGIWWESKQSWNGLTRNMKEQALLMFEGSITVVKLAPRDTKRSLDIGLKGAMLAWHPF